MSRAPRPLTLIIGYFDPYHAVHARRLHAVKFDHSDGTLAVALDDPAEPLLSLQARAELLASLAVVDLVTTGDVSAMRADMVLDLRQEDAELAAALRRHVLERNGMLSR